MKARNWSFLLIAKFGLLTLYNHSMWRSPSSKYGSRFSLSTGNIRYLVFIWIPRRLNSSRAGFSRFRRGGSSKIWREVGGWQEDQVEEVGGRADGGGRVHRTPRKRAPGPGHEHKVTLGVCRQRKWGGEGRPQNPNFLFPFVLIIC